MYQTKQKSNIINILVENKDKHLNAEEIYMILKNNNTSVSLATLYRCLDKLVSENLVRKYTSTHLGKACYQYIDKSCTLHNHFHLVCEKCQKLIHIDCKMIEDFIEHIEKHHNFKVQREKVVYYGLCEDCRGEV